MPIKYDIPLKSAAGIGAGAFSGRSDRSRSSPEISDALQTTMKPQEPVERLGGHVDTRVVTH